MDNDLDIQIVEALKAYLASGVEDQVDYQKFYLYSIVTHSTAIEGSTVTEIENQLLFDESIAAKGCSLTEQMMNVDLKDAYLHAFKIASENPTYTPQLLQQLSALVMRRTGSEYSTIAGQLILRMASFDCAMSVLELAVEVILPIIKFQVPCRTSANGLMTKLPI